MKSTTTNLRLRAVASSFLIVLGLVAALTAVSSPAQASSQAGPKADPRLGYAAPEETDSYLAGLLAAGEQILYVDTTHQDEGGFWFAHVDNSSPRGFSWAYQPWGVWCGESHVYAEYNAFLNVYTCQVNEFIQDTRDPGWSERSTQCRVDTGLPWKVQKAGAPTLQCADDRIDLRTSAVRQDTPQRYGCAVWETTPCSSVRYPWDTSVPNSSVPVIAPDTCTGLPGNFNVASPALDPADFVATDGGDGSCDGLANPTRCNYDATAGACSADEQFYATRGASESVSLTASISATRRAEPVTVTRSATVKRRSHGRLVRATVRKWATFNVAVSATRSASAPGTGHYISTASCFGTTMALAEKCATERARADARATATAGATQLAQDKALPRAQRAAQTAANAAALRSLGPRMKSINATLTKKAKKAARAKVMRKIRRLNR